MGKKRNSFFRKVNLFFKRFFDLLFSVFLLFLLLPVFIIVAVLIKVNSKGPVFFYQNRLGKDLSVFQIVKFRTMVTNAENMGDGLFVYGDQDNRITSVGKILRKTSVDELPQLFNIIKGDMSLVGPRPPVTYFPYKAEEYDAHKKRRFEMRPGITGIAQVRTRTTAPWDERIEYDVEYIENFNIWLDIKVVFGTVKTLFSKKNIYPETREQIYNGKKNDDVSN